MSKFYFSEGFGIDLSQIISIIFDADDPDDQDVSCVNLKGGMSMINEEVQNIEIDILFDKWKEYTMSQRRT